MSLEKYLSNYHSNEAAYAVVNTKTNELIHTFQTDIVARAFQQSTPDSKVIWLSRRNIQDVLRGQANN